MKRIPLLFLFLCISIYSHSQGYSNISTVAKRLNISEEQALEYLNVPEADIMAYLQKNISTLDQIEGFYDIHQEGRNNGRDLGEDDYKFYIFKASDGNLYVHNGERIVKGLLVEKLGDQNIYKFTYQTLSLRGEPIRKSIRIPLDNTSFFETTFTYSDEEFGGTITETLSWIKEYPKTDDFTSSSSNNGTQKKDNWCGTSFAISNDVLVTNSHIIEDANTIEITGLNGNFAQRYNVSVIGADKHNDLALLQITDKNFPGFTNIPYKIDFVSRDAGTPINVAGYFKPFSSREGVEIKTGSISAKNGYQGDATSYKISFPIHETTSGGPLIDAKGDIVGIANYGVSAEDDASYAIKSTCLRGLFEAFLDNRYSATNNSLSGLSYQEQLEKMRPYVAMILCSSQSTINIEDFKETSLENVDAGRPIPFISGLRAVLVPSNDGYITIDNPIYSSARTLKIERIVMSDILTIVDCYINVPFFADYVTIKPSTKLVADQKDYKLITAKGIALAPKRSYPPSGEYHFTLYFDPVPKTVAEISIIEPGGFNIKGVKVK